MNFATKLVICLSTLLTLSACEKEPNPESDREKTVYSLGIETGALLSKYHLTESDMKFFKAGLDDKMLGREAKLDSAQYMGKIQEMGGGNLPESIPVQEKVSEVAEPKPEAYSPPPPPAKIQPKAKAKGKTTAKAKAKTKPKPKVAAKKVVKKKTVKKKPSIEN